MKVLGIRFCKVATAENAAGIAAMLGENGLGLKPRDMGEALEGFQGAVFPVGDDNGSDGRGSWIEVWAAAENMPEMTMLQIVVDDADAFADFAKKNGLDVSGPDIAHGERIYYLAGPGEFPVAFLSKAG